MDAIRLVRVGTCDSLGVRRKGRDGLLEGTSVSVLFSKWTTKAWQPVNTELELQPTTLK